MKKIIGIDDTLRLRIFDKREYDANFIRLFIESLIQSDIKYIKYDYFETRLYPDGRLRSVDFQKRKFKINNKIQIDKLIKLLTASSRLQGLHKIKFLGISIPIYRYLTSVGKIEIYSKYLRTSIRVHTPSDHENIMELWMDTEDFLKNFYVRTKFAKSKMIKFYDIIEVLLKVLNPVYSYLESGYDPNFDFVSAINQMASPNKSKQIVDNPFKLFIYFNNEFASKISKNILTKKNMRKYYYVKRHKTGIFLRLKWNKWPKVNYNLVKCVKY